MTYAKFKSAQRPLVLASSHRASISARSDCAGSRPLLGEPRLDVMEAADELAVRRAQRALGIELQVARDVGDARTAGRRTPPRSPRDPRRPPFGIDRAAPPRARPAPPSSFGKHGCERGPVEADLGRFVLQLDRARERRERHRHIVEHAASRRSANVRRVLRCSWRDPRSPARRRRRAPPSCRTRADGGGSSWR